ncbi:MAG: peptide deformylase [Pygmaiobacter massiliensis]|nr:peptide deformylase [Pygmaiobacter massiliensis]
MALRTIVLDGDPILKKVCRPVTDFGEKTAQLLDDMKQTLIKAEGLGLAGPQVGMLRRICIVVDLPPEDDGTAPAEGEDLEYQFIELVNPQIIETEGKVGLYEGCLSFPGHNGWIERPETVTVKAQDRNGNEFTVTRTGMTARAICHECDHLDGVTIMDLADHFYEDEEKD